MKRIQNVIPAKAGTQAHSAARMNLGSRLRGNDSCGLTFCCIAVLIFLSGCTTDTIPNNSIRLDFAFKSGAPLADSLLPAYPNPFNRAAGDTAVIIRFTVKDSGAAVILIQNPIGDAVAEYSDTLLAPGTYAGSWPVLDANQSALNSGLYFVTLHLQNYVLSRLVNVQTNE